MQDRAGSPWCSGQKAGTQDRHDRGIGRGLPGGWQRPARQPRGTGGKAATVIMLAVILRWTSRAVDGLAGLAQQGLGRQAGKAGGAGALDKATEAKLQDKRIKQQKHGEETRPLAA